MIASAIIIDTAAQRVDVVVQLLQLADLRQFPAAAGQSQASRVGLRTRPVVGFVIRVLLPFQVGGLIQDDAAAPVHEPSLRRTRDKDGQDAKDGKADGERLGHFREGN